MHFKGSAGPRAAPAESLYYICYFRYDSKGILCKTWPKGTFTLMRRVIVIELVVQQYTSKMYRLTSKIIGYSLTAYFP